MENDKRHEKSWNDPPMFSMEQLNNATGNVHSNKRYRYPPQPAAPVGGMPTPGGYQQYGAPPGANPSMAGNGFGGGYPGQQQSMPSPYSNQPQGYGGMTVSQLSYQAVAADTRQQSQAQAPLDYGQQSYGYPTGPSSMPQVQQPPPNMYQTNSYPQPQQPTPPPPGLSSAPVSNQYQSPGYSPASQSQPGLPQSYPPPLSSTGPNGVGYPGGHPSYPQSNYPAYSNPQY